MKNALILFAALGCVALACDDHDGHGGGADAAHHHDDGGQAELNDIQIGCQHFEFGPNVAITAVAAGGAAELIEEPHHRYNIALQAGAGEVLYTPQTMGTYLLMLDRDVPFKLLSGGVEVAPKLIDRPVPDCAAAAVVYHFILDVAPYTLSFGPEAGDAVSLVIHLPAAGGHMHEGDAGHMHEGDAGHMHEGDAGHMHEGDAGHMHEGDAGHMHEGDAGHEHEGDAGHEHETDAGHEHETDAAHHHDDDGGHEVPDGGEADPPGAAYCECMLFHCHEDFHATFGESDEEATAACRAAAAELPRAGAEVTEGNFLECRAHFCEQAESSGDQAANCPQALGQSVCL